MKYLEERGGYARPKQVVTAAEEAGHERSTLYRARKEIAVSASRKRNRRSARGSLLAGDNLLSVPATIEDEALWEPF